MNALAASVIPEQASGRIEQAWQVLAQIPDPEVPAVSLCDLGMVRSVTELGEALEVALTPTYSGCPATEMIEQSVIEGLQAAGLGPVQVRLQRAQHGLQTGLLSKGVKNCVPMALRRLVPCRRTSPFACALCHALSINWRVKAALVMGPSPAAA